MEKIASFCVDHTHLLPGIYRSRVDGDVTTYDLRFVRPNHPPYLSNPILHTIEHLFATMARNSSLKDQIIYFGPMGCRTGFYLLMRNPEEDCVLDLIRDIIKRIAEYEGEIPGTSAEECGNYLEHDLDGAKKAAADYYTAVRSWTKKDLEYVQ